MSKPKKDVTVKRAVTQLIIYITAKVVLTALVRKAILHSLEQRAKSAPLSPDTLRALEAIGRSVQEGPKVTPAFDSDAMSAFEAFMTPKEA